MYFDPNDWWVGYYRGDRHHYVGFLCAGITWRRRHPDGGGWAIDIDIPADPSGFEQAVASYETSQQEIAKGIEALRIAGRMRDIADWIDKAAKTDVIPRALEQDSVLEDLRWWAECLTDTGTLP